ncbi:probable catabolite repression protein creC isoform X2 [Rutidosis leptorrhynchoides]|uniref:probable catabolite repression protein creC isoform X2 n=1 Tax=Rutidosis leptorrhynchoides TaxID=125765 RepID=UPI003A99B853
MFITSTSNPMTSSASNNYNTACTTGTSGSGGQQPAGLKTYFKTPEGRYKLKYEKSHPTGFLHYAHGKSVTQVTLACVKEKSTVSLPSSSSSLSLGVGSGVRSAAAKLLGGNGSKTLGIVGGNGGSSKLLSGTSKVGLSGTSNTNSYSNNNINFDGKGTYLVFNVGDAIFISDLSSQDKDPIKSIHFSNSNPISHAFNPDARDGHDLLIGLNCGDVYSVSLRLQLQDIGKKLVGAQHYNKDGCVNNSRCTSIAWVPNGDGTFVVAHADGNMYVYEKFKEGDPSFPAIKDPTQFSVSHARYSKNPIARWHICQGSINSITFSGDGAYIATVGRDGYLRVFDFKTEQLVCGGKSYYGALLCCSWSMDGKYILTGGEDDLVQVWSMEERKVVAWGEGHSSWVSGVAFDSYWSAPNTDDAENVVYRFGSVGQDTQLLLWDLEMNEIVVPLRRAAGGSPTFSTGSQSAHWDNGGPVGGLQPAPSMRDVPIISPLVVHRAESEPLSGLIFTRDSILTVCREGHIKIWTRPTSDSESVSDLNLNEKPFKVGTISSNIRQ